MEPKTLPLTEDGRIELLEFVDPLFGSERHLHFKPEWIESVEDKLFKVPLQPWRKYPMTIVTLKNGRVYRADGYWANEIKAAMVVAEVVG